MKMKKIILSVIICLLSYSVFALEEYVSDVYRQLDRIFAAKSEAQLNNLLNLYHDDKYYYLIENYAQKKIRRLIVNHDYDFAMESIIVVIENNLENEEAVEMYSAISDAYEVQKKYEEQEAIKKEMEIAKLEKEKEKHRASANKEYASAAKKGGGVVYITGKETKLTSYWWKAAFGLVDFTYVLETSGPVNNINYGISASFDYEYTRDTIIWGVFAFTDVKFLSLGTGIDSVPLMINLDVGPKIGFVQFSRNFFIKAGFTNLIVSGLPQKSTVVSNFITPTVGFCVERVSLGNMLVGLGLEYYPGHLWTPGINAAFGGEANVCIPFAELNKVKLNMNVGIKERCILKSSGFENRASLILAIGVENVSK